VTLRAQLVLADRYIDLQGARRDSIGTHRSVANGFMTCPTRRSSVARSRRVCDVTLGTACTGPRRSRPSHSWPVQYLRTRVAELIVERCGTRWVARIRTNWYLCSRRWKGGTLGLFQYAIEAVAICFRCFCWFSTDLVSPGDLCHTHV